MNRAEFRQVALVRLADAQVLLQARRYAAAYYLAGYVIECALKACIARQFRRADIPDSRLVTNVYTHDLTKLLRLAELDQHLSQEAARDRQFSLYWGTVREWSEISRYDAQRSRAEAQELVRAVADPTYGVLRWLQQHW